MAAVELKVIKVTAFMSSCLYFYNYTAEELFCSLQSSLFIYKFLSANVSEKELKKSLHISVLLPLPHDNHNTLCHN